MTGLYHLLAAKDASRISLVRNALRPGISPADLHDATAITERLEKEIDQLAESIVAEEFLIIDIGHMIDRLEKTNFKTAHRTLALRHLEDAQSSLIRELGDKPGEKI